MVLSIWLWLAIVFGLSTISVSFGLKEIDNQNKIIKSLIDADYQDRQSESEKLKTWGGAAYYNFHLTYDLPSNFAFAAIGMRDIQPWKHRIRMLALEGQIYERDVGNPVTALIGRFDFSFFVAFIIPIILIILLHDLRAREIIAGRQYLLEATVRQALSFWFIRACVPSCAIFLCLILPLIVAGIIAATPLATLFLASLSVFLYIFFWTFLCFFISLWRKSDSVILMTLLTIWILTSVVLPVAARIIIDRLVPVPSGADILLLQREAVNDAWDLPREVTMNAFFERHPQWSDYQPIKNSFEWQWYYAFQQVGDQKTENLSTDYKDGRLKRDCLAAWISWLLPASFIERRLQSLANTNLASSIAYEKNIRDYHAALRNFYYPRLFRNESFDKNQLKNLPTYSSNR